MFYNMASVFLKRIDSIIITLLLSPENILRGLCTFQTVIHNVKNLQSQLFVGETNNSSNDPVLIFVLVISDIVPTLAGISRF